MKRKTRRVGAFLLALAFVAPPLGWAQGLPAAAPESVGLSAARLRRLSETMKRYVDEGKIAGAVTLVARDGRVAHLEAFGRADLDRSAAMEKDSIFRIASMSKALTSVAVMMLHEEHRAVHDPGGCLRAHRPPQPVPESGRADDGEVALTY